MKRHADYRITDGDKVVREFRFKAIPTHKAAELRRLYTAMHEGVQPHIARAKELEELSPEDQSAHEAEAYECLRAVHAVVNGSNGYLLWRLMDTEIVVEGQMPPDIRGLAFYEALWEAGWDDDQITAATAHGLLWLGTLMAPPPGLPDVEQVKEIVDFGKAPKESSTVS